MLFKRKSGGCLPSLFLLALLSSSGTGNAEQNGMDQLVESLTGAKPVFVALRSKIDTSQFDREHLLDALDYDEERIIAFASDQLRFEAYDGLLRGPDGTLTSRAGNALDQAVFLAAMLKDAGLEARVAEGELQEADAARLLRSMTQEAEPVNPFITDDEFTQLVHDLNTAFAKSEPRQNTDIPDFERVRTVTGDILSLLDDSGVELGRDLPNWSDTVNDTRNYSWVQYRSSASGTWENLHPAFGSQPAPEVEPQRYFEDQVPEDRMHRLRITGFLSQTLPGDVRQKKVVVPAWEQPTALLTGRTIRYQNFPDGLSRKWTDAERDADTRELITRTAIAVGESRFFLPMIDDQIAPGADAFDLSGNTVPPDVAGSFMAGLFQEQADNVGEAISALSGSGESSSSALTLAEYWLEFELIAPDGERTRFQRYLARSDMAGDALPLALSREVEVTIETGRPSTAQLLDTTLQRLLAAIEEIQFLLNDDEREIRPAETSAPAGVANSQYLASTLLLPGALDATHIYRPRAALIASYRPVVSLSEVPEAAQGMDILSDYHRVWVEDRASPSTLRLSPQKTIEIGVAQTMLEAKAPFPGATPDRNAFHEWDTTDSRNSAVLTRTTPGRQSPAARTPQSLNRDLEQGHVAVAQWDRDSGNQPATWWRLLPGSGETLGMNDYGWGGVRYLYSAESAKYSIFIGSVKNIIGPARFARVLAKCNLEMAAISAASLHLRWGGAMLGPASQSIGTAMQIAGTAIGQGAFFETYMRRCILRNMWTA